MLKVIAHIFLKPEFLEKAEGLLAELVAETRKEEACIAYDLFLDEEDNEHFTFIEEWPDHKALELHMQTEHFTRIVPKLKDNFSKPQIVFKMKQKF